MGLPESIWERMKRGDYSQTDATVAEVLCSVGRQLAFRLDKLIDIQMRGPEEAEGIIPLTPGVAYTPIGRLVELMRLNLASYPRNHSFVVVTNVASLMITNPLPYTIPLMLTNQDNAQFLYYGSSSVGIGNAPLIDPETSMKILLSPNSDLWGIVAGANINVAISNLDLPIV